MKNLAYYLRETKSLLGAKTALAILSTAMLLFLSMSLTSAYFVSREYTELLAGEAQVSVFYSSPESRDRLISDLARITGVKDVQSVSEEEAYEEMKSYLGDEARLLDRLPENPFQAYLRVIVDANIPVERLDEIKKLPFVTFVRDNREVLHRISSLTSTIAVVGGITVLLSLLTAACITYYVASENLHARRETVEILLILGAPQRFILRPFLWHSVLINLLAGLISGIVLFLAASALAIEMSLELHRVALSYILLAIVIGAAATYISSLSVGREYRI